MPEKFLRSFGDGGIFGKTTGRFSPGRELPPPKASLDWLTEG